MWFGAAPFWLLLITYFLSRIPSFQKYTNLTNLTYIYAIGAMAYSYISMQFPWFWYPGIIYLVRVVDPEISMRLWQLWWAPAPEICKLLAEGGLSIGEIPWDAWSPVILFYTVLFDLYAISLISMVNIFRRLWIDIERIPFPHAMVAYEFLKRIPPATVVSEPKKARKDVPFVAGVILGICFELPIILAILFPWLPDIYGWRDHTCLGGTHVVYADEIANHPIYSVVVGLGSLNKNPATVAAAYFAPLDILFSASCWFVIILMLVQVWYYLGYYTANMSYGSCCRSWGPDCPSRAPPLNWHVIEAGGLYMIAITELFLYRRYIIQTIRKALGKPSEFEDSEEPGTYRLNWSLFIVSNALLIGLWMINGLSIPIATLLIVQNLLHAIAQLLYMGKVSTPHVWWEGNTFFRLIWPNPPEPWYNVSYEQFHAHAFGMVMTSLNEPTCFPVYGAAFAYRMNDLTKTTSNRNLFKTIILVPLILIPIALIMQVVIWSAYGWSHTAFYQGWGYAAYFGQTEPYIHPSSTPPSEWWPWFVGGAIIVLILQYLRTRFLWFPFEPLGFLMAHGYTTLQRGLASTFIIAWFLKWLTLKVGGSKLYENYGIPIAAGFLVGYMAINFFAGLVGVYRWFFPF
ncbi:hypothetical protein DRO58_01725 [Candidatus Bathyarchaeota archaeon]|nr:MAG: hypothetical protein DRO58_01725 [Candidatus Bathyarchaeota archaeon]